MADIRVSVKLNELGMEFESLTQDLVDGLVGTCAQLANLTFNRAVEMAGDRLHSTRQEYLDALHTEQEGEGVFTVYLDPEADHLEDGYAPFGMLPKLFQGPKAKTAKDGSKYVVIPIRKEVGGAVPGSNTGGDMAKALRQVVSDRKFKLSKSGVSKTTGKFTTVERYTGAVPHPNLKGLTRVREYSGSKKEGRPTSSALFVFRVASSKQNPATQWKHPGFKGANIFPDLERWADTQMEQILREFFS